ncbi:hypothetical protein HQ45_02560 [Porphyromonas crevioricanis]|uniref:FAD:protein FMN transferase n=1 Tax=Porphyromonas crevioricanis TaxID=393921 RepID=A0AB34PIB1_9PORP|nr:hypothetical protein HQ45_02560 [Porphyromonas crevioricanis]KGN95101.1 hypothetical protein HQ38_04820 [Porphyromonas crevioricanis]
MSSLKTLLFLGFLSALWGCQDHSAPYFRQEGCIWGTYYHITYQHDSVLTNRIARAFSELDRSINPFDSLSLISRINENKGFDTDSLFRLCFEETQRIAQLSDGAFDPTCSPLFNAWGFGFKHREKMDKYKVDSLLRFVGYSKISLENDSIRKMDPRMTLDFASIAKGLGADHIAHTLELQGVKNYLVEIGGEIAYSGSNPMGQAWQIGIDRPTENNRNNSGDLQCLVRLPKNKSGLATSGNYRNYYELNGQRYAHTIDPRTGYPVQTDVLSATVLAPNCMIADALATAFMVVGSEKASELAKKIEEVEYLLICTAEGENTRIVFSPNFEKLIQKQ